MQINKYHNKFKQEVRIFNNNNSQHNKLYLNKNNNQVLKMRNFFNKAKQAM